MPNGTYHSAASPRKINIHQHEFGQLSAASFCYAAVDRVLLPNAVNLLNT
jgi:hypothetical protein